MAFFLLLGLMVGRGAGSAVEVQVKEVPGPRVVVTKIKEVEVPGPVTKAELPTACVELIDFITKADLSLNGEGNEVGTLYSILQTVDTQAITGDLTGLVENMNTARDAKSRYENSALTRIGNTAEMPEVQKRCDDELAK